MSQERYEIKKKLGEGGAGAVYIAHDTRLDREVALKRVAAEQGGWSQDTVDSMLKEARMLSSITHPNIVTIYDADVDDDGPYVVMELLKGRNIDDLIAESTLTASDFQDFSTQCLEALIAAHSLDLIHRDIKPNNIVLKWLPSGKFQAKLLDFGMAKLTKEPTKQTVDQSDSVFGSIYFMAPEQFERTELDARTDLYALGSVFYYTLTGFYPFTGDSPAEVMASHLMHRVKPITDYRDDLPEWLTNWVMWLLNREMEHRPQTAQEALDLFSANLSVDPLKNTSAVSTKFNADAEDHYFGQADAGSNGPKINKAATKQENVGVLAPVLLTVNGQLAAPAAEASEEIPIAQATVKVAQPAVANTVKLATPAAGTVQLATPTPAKKVALNTGATPAAEPTAQLASPTPAQATPAQVAVQQPKTVKLAAPSPEPVAQKETPLATVPLESPQAPAQPGQTTELASPDPSYGAQSTVALASPNPAQASKAPASANAAGAKGGPTKLKKVASKNPSGESIELPTADSIATPKSNNGLIAILSVVVLALIVVGALLAIRMGENKKIEALNEILAPAKKQQKNIPTTREDVKALTEQLYTVSGQFENNLIYQRLLDAESADGTDIDYAIADFATQPGNEILPDVRNALFLVLGGREGGSSTVPTIQRFIDSYGKEDVVINAISSLKNVATDDDLDFFIDIILTSDSSGKREAAEKTAAALINASKNPESLVSKLSSAHTKASGAMSKAAFDRLIGIIGGDSAKERIQAGLASKERTKVIPALSMLQNWKDGSMTQEAIDFWVSTTEKTTRDKAFDAVFRLMKNHHMEDPNAKELWTQIAENAQTSSEKMDVLLGLGASKADYAAPLIKPFLNDTNSAVISKAKRAMKNIQKDKK